MAIRYAIEKHASAYPTKCLASEGGAHIYNIQLSSDTDNGNFIGKGECLELDLYAEDTATEISAKILPFKAPNGNFYVEIIDNPSHALFVYQVPQIEEDFTSRFQKESNFFNAADETVRAYDVVTGDIVEISAEGFSGTPAVNATISSITNKKLVIA
jgi:hypothetical protein